MKLTGKSRDEITLELWTFLEETGKEKEEWDGWEKYGEMEAKCPLCEYSMQHKGGCRSCPLNKFEEGCYNEALSFTAWEMAKTTEESKKFAGEFLNQLKEVLNA